MRCPKGQTRDIRLTCLGLMLTVIAGCTSSTVVREAGAKAALAGVASCEAALKTYEKLAAVRHEQARLMSESAAIANGPAYALHEAKRVPIRQKISALEETIAQDPKDQNAKDALEQEQANLKSSGAFPFVRPTPADFTKQLGPRVAAFRQLRTAYLEFGKLSGKDYGADTSAAVNSLTSAINSLTSIPDLNEQTRGFAAEVAKQIVGRIQAGEIQKQNKQLLRVTEAFSKAWSADQPAWEDYTKRVRDSYANTLTSMTIDDFDEKRLADSLDSPFNKASNVLLYKVRLTSGTSSVIDQAEAGLGVTAASLENAKAAHEELTKPQPVLAQVQFFLDSTLTLLETLKPQKAEK